MSRDLLDKEAKVFPISLAQLPLSHELTEDPIGVLSRHLPLIERLYCTAPGANTAFDQGRCFLIHALSLRINDTISIATIAASAPLLPALVPARSIACSIVSTVSTPKATGISNSVDMAASPNEQ